MIEIVPATMTHARAIDLRPGDAAEIAAMGLDKLGAVESALARALWADTYLVDGEVAAIAGVSVESLLGGRVTAWLLTGRPVDRHAKSFVRLTRGRSQEMLARHGNVTCNVHAGYAAAIRWLRHLGFSISPARPLGPNGALFHEATLCKRGPVAVRAADVAAIESAASFPALALEYAEETHLPGMPPPLARWPAYRALEEAGVLSVFGAWSGDELVGFITLLIARLPRYDEQVAMCESFFVARAHRRSGAGLRLLRLAEAKARELGARGPSVSAPVRGNLFRVLPRLGYGEAARVFFKKVRNA